MAGELGAGGQREQLVGLHFDLVAAEGEVRRDGGGELDGGVVACGQAASSRRALGGDLRRSADRLVVVLEDSARSSMPAWPSGSTATRRAMSAG
jgi:hypothetical protein